MRRTLAAICIPTVLLLCVIVAVTDESSMRGSFDHEKRSVSAELHRDVSVRHELVIPVVSRRSDLLRTPLTSTRTHAVTHLCIITRSVAVAGIADRTASSGYSRCGNFGGEEFESSGSV